MNNESENVQHTYLELRLAPRERKVSESDHVLGKKVQLNKLSFHLAGDNIQNNVHLDLSLHSDAEEGDEVHD